MNPKCRPCSTCKLMRFSTSLVYLVCVICGVAFPEFFIFLAGARFST